MKERETEHFSHSFSLFLFKFNFNMYFCSFLTLSIPLFPDRNFFSLSPFHQWHASWQKKPLGIWVFMYILFSHPLFLFLYNFIFFFFDQLELGMIDSSLIFYHKSSVYSLFILKFLFFFFLFCQLIFLDTCDSWACQCYLEPKGSVHYPHSICRA